MISHLLRSLACAAVAALWAGFGSGFVRADSNTPRILLSDQAEKFTVPRHPQWAKLNKPETGQAALWLRPNTKQELYLYVENPRSKQQVFTVRLLAAGSAKELAIGTANVPRGEKRPVQWTPLKPSSDATKTTAPADAAKTAAPAAGIPLPPGPPFELIVELLDGNKKQVGKPRAIPVGILVPQDYVEAKAWFNRTKKILYVTAEGTDWFTGPEARVELSVWLPIPDTDRRERVKLTEGRFDGKLQTAGGDGTAPKVQLQAVNPLAASKSSGGDALVYVSVDNYERAFSFVGAFEGGSGDRPLLRVNRGNETIHANAAKFSPLADKYSVPIEVDNFRHDLETDKPVDRRVEVQLLKNRDRVAQAPRSGHRQESISMSPAEDGALAFTTKVTDWNIELDTEGVGGACELTASLKDEAGEDVKRDVKPVSIGLTKPQNIVVDMPAQEAPGKRIRVRARSDGNGPDIKEAHFFVGKPGKDDAPPDKQTDGKRSQENRSEWFADLDLPMEKGPVPVSVVLVNDLDERAAKTGLIDLVEAPKPDAGTGGDAGAAKPAPVVGTIKGVIMEADRRQPGLEVTLSDEKGTKIDSVDADDKGEFVFKDVKPGRYTVSAVKTKSKRKGKKDVRVQEKNGKAVTTPETVTIKLSAVK
jgi:hypothetical protein